MNQLFLALAIGLPTGGDKSPIAPEPVAQETDEWKLDLGGRWDLVVGPAESFYPGYLAAQHRSTLGLKSLHVNDSEIMGAGGTRFGLRIGRQFELCQLVPGNRPEEGIQIGGEVGILADFDRDNSTDNIGWDGIYGLHVSWLAARDLALRVGFAHDSSHLGDEFIESTGRARIGYTREELRAGASWRFAEGCRAYGEYGHGYDLRNQALQEPGRAEVGIELQLRESPWRGRSRPYLAIDVSSYEENDWEGNYTVQVGLATVATDGTTWRLGLELYDGRSPFGEFFQEEETHVAWGLWFDF